MLGCYGVSGLLWSVGFLSCFCRGFHRVLRFLLSMECWSSLEWLVFTESEEFLYNGKVFIENREVCGCGMVSRFL